MLNLYGWDLAETSGWYVTVSIEIVGSIHGSAIILSCQLPGQLCFVKTSTQGNNKSLKQSVIYPPFLV